MLCFTEEKRIYKSMFKALHFFKYLHHKYCPVIFISNHGYLDSNVVFKVYTTQRKAKLM